MGGTSWSQIGGDSEDATRDRSSLRQGVAPALGLVLLVALAGWRFGVAVAVGVAILAAAIVGILHLLHALHTATRLVDRAASFVASAVGAVLLTALWLPLVFVPWLFDRLVRWDPTWTPRLPSSRWIALTAGEHRPSRMWVPDRRRVRSTPGRRVHRVLVGLTVIALLAMTTGIWLSIDQAKKEHERYGMAALADEPWWPKISDAVDMSYSQSPISSFVGGVLMRDTTFPGFNVRDRSRLSWRPPASACRPIVVWMFGGSTMFGLGQRDDHTIPSELARTAWKDGLPLEVRNWGVPADMFWMETRRLELALAEGNDAPDLVVFYDGANDFRVQANMNGHGLGGALFFPNDLDATALNDLRADNERLAWFMAMTRDAPKMAPENHPTLSPEEVGTRGAAAYSQAARLVEPLLASRGIPWVQFYQPSRATRAEPLASERSYDGTDDSFWKQVEPAFRARLDPHVVDLSGAMDQTREPVYYDELHTNELGARVVADAIYEHLRQQLAEASARINEDRACR